MTKAPTRSGERRSLSSFFFSRFFLSVLELTASFALRRATKTAASADKRVKAASASEEDSPPGKPRPFALLGLSGPPQLTEPRPLAGFCRSTYEGYEGDAPPAPKDAGATVKEERYSPWASENGNATRNDSPARGDPPDVYGTEQLVPAPASYQPYR